METGLVGIAVVLALALLTGVGGIVLLPTGWAPLFGSVVGVSGIGLGLTGYAIRQA
jgi:hypothetical protein